jgi:hypothetical protein
MTNSKANRRWYQFSMRTLLLVMMLFALLLGAWVERSRRQHNAAREIELLGASVYYGEPSSLVIAFPFVEDMLDPDMLMRVEEVQFTSYHGRVTDVDKIIPFLKRLPCLRRVILFPLQEHMVPQLRDALPGVEIEIIRGGVPLVG